MMIGKQILLVLCASTLVACGSSSDTTSSFTAGALGDQGLKLVAQKASGAVKSHSTYVSTSDINQLVVNGRTINLVPASSTNTDFTNLFDLASGVNGDNLPRIVSGTKYSNTRFGLIKNNDEIIAFSQGKVTDVNSIPATGKVIYKGDYVGYDHRNNVAGTGLFTGTADFGAKTFTVFAETDNRGVPGINITGVISGNSFTGKIGNTVETKGQFYGNNAEEVGGTYNNNGFDGYHYTAAFGAKKQ